MHTKDKLAEFTAERRQALKDNDMDKFKDVVYRAGYFEQIASRTITAYFYEHLKISIEVFSRSDQVHLGDPHLRARFQQLIERSRAQLVPPQLKPLEKQEVIEAQKFFEEKKYEMHCTLFTESLDANCTPQNIQAMQALEKLKAEDSFFNEMGYEYANVVWNVERLNLQQDSELIQII